jgi:protein-tyrosine phosphatase
VVEATRIFPGLYLGSRPPLGSELARAGFTTLLLCASEYQPRSSNFPGLQAVIHVPLEDAKPTDRELALASSAALLVAQRQRRGERVLVSCSMGRNRSGLVAALALSRLTSCSPAAAARLIALLRTGPDGFPALSNLHFLRALEQLPGLSRENSELRRRTWSEHR